MAIGNMGGRPATPTRMKALRGTLRPGRINPNEPKPELSSLRPPVYLNDEERKQWKAVAKELVSMRVLTTADRTTLGRYCQPQVVYNTIYRQVEYNPKMVNVLLKLAAELRSLEVLFGLNPSSRTRIHATPPDKPENKLSKYLERRFFGDVA